LAVLICEKHSFKSLQDVSVLLVSNFSAVAALDMLRRYFVIWCKQKIITTSRVTLFKRLNSHFIQSKRPVTKINI